MIAHVRKYYEADLRTLKNFGLVMAICLIVVFYLAFPFLFSFSYKIWPSFLAVAFLLLAFISPTILRFVYVPWMVLGSVLGYVNTRIILGIIFYLMITPMAFLFRLIGRDKMDRKTDVYASTYRKKGQILHLNEHPY